MRVSEPKTGTTSEMNWIVSQIGAREHYAIPRALHANGALEALLTDFWVPPGVPLRRIPALRRLQDRYHPDLRVASVFAPHSRMLIHELVSKIRQRRGWPDILERNAHFQRAAVTHLRRRFRLDHSPKILFSYSYAARDLFRFARSRGWKTVLGQIDPGPEEERIVVAEHRRYPKITSTWQPAPATYWDEWREELDLSDIVVANSEWSRECLLQSGVAAAKVRVVPLVYGRKNVDETGATRPSHVTAGELAQNAGPPPFKILFLGQINLRKGVARLLEAMRLLKDDPVDLAMVGPTEIDPASWADLPRVKWLGPVPRSEVAKHYQEADVFILPTLSDGYALTQLEALAHGLPVIASTHCGAVVQPGQNGWILPDLEPETIAQTVRRARDCRLSGGTKLVWPGIQDLASALQHAVSTP